MTTTTLYWTDALPHHYIAIRGNDMRLIPAHECNGHPMRPLDDYPAYRGHVTGLHRAAPWVEEFCRLCDEEI